MPSWRQMLWTSNLTDVLPIAVGFISSRCKLFRQETVLLMWCTLFTWRIHYIVQRAWLGSSRWMIFTVSLSTFCILQQFYRKVTERCCLLTGAWNYLMGLLWMITTPVAISRLKNTSSQMFHLEVSKRHVTPKLMKGMFTKTSEIVRVFYVMIICSATFVVIVVVITISLYCYSVFFSNSLLSFSVQNWSIFSCIYLYIASFSAKSKCKF